MKWNISDSIFGVVLFLCQLNAFAQLSFTDLKGLQSAVQLKPEYSYLDPIHGFNLSKQGLLTNLYKYPVEDENGKLNDPSEILIQGTFNIPPTSDNPIFFQVSPLAKNFGRFLGPSTIGSIFHVFLSHSPSQSNRDQIAEALKKAILGDPEFNQRLAEANLRKENLQKEIDIYLSEINELEKIISEKRQAVNQLKSRKNKFSLEIAQCNLDENADHTKIDQLTQEVSVLLDQFNSGSEDLKKLTDRLAEKKLAFQKKDHPFLKLKNKQDRENYKPEYLDLFVSRLLDSWLNEGSPHSLYPKHFTEQVLLAIAWMNTPDEDKKGFVGLYEKIPHVLVTGNIHDSGQFNQKYTRSDYQQLVHRVSLLRDPAIRAQFLLAYPDQTAFLAYGRKFFDLNDLPELGYKQVRYQHPRKNEVSFPDCMDSSVLNALAIFLRNPQTGLLETKPLQNKLKAKSFKLHPDLKTFISTHSEPSSLDTLSTHEQWIPLISGLKNVKYVNEDYEMETTLSNLFHSMEHLLLGGSDLSKFPPPWINFKKNSQKLDSLCQLLSRDDFQLDWELKGRAKSDLDQKDTDVELVFKINGSPAFTWNISSLHSEIEIEKKSKKDWRDRVVPELASRIMKNREDQKITDLDYQTLIWLLEPQGGSQTAQTLKFEKGTSQAIHLSLSTPLLRVEDKLGAIDEILASKEQMPINRAKKLMKSLPSSDLNTQVQLLDLILKHHQEILLKSNIDHFFSTFTSPEQQKMAVFDSVSRGYLDTLKLFAQKEFKLNEPNRSGTTPIQVAAQLRKWDIVQFLADKYPESISKTDLDSKTILHLAVESQKWDVVEFLSAKNPSSLLKGDFFRVTPLQILATTGKWDVIQSIVPFLKDSPDQLSRRDTEGKTLLQRARESGQYQLVRYLESLNVK